MAAKTDRLSKNILLSLAGLGLGLSLLALWHYLHIGDYLSPEELSDFFEKLRGNPWMPLTIIGIYVCSGLFLFPVSVLSLAIALAYDPLTAVSISMAGAMANAAVYYGGGRILHAYKQQHFMGGLLTRVKKGLDKGGVAGVAIVHMLPIAPFTVVNLSLGILAVPFVIYILGTFLALLPGMVIRSLLGNALWDIIERPDAESVTYVTLGVIPWIGVVVLTHLTAQRISRKQIKQNPARNS